MENNRIKTKTANSSLTIGPKLMNTYFRSHRKNGCTFSGNFDHRSFVSVANDIFRGENNLYYRHYFCIVLLVRANLLKLQNVHDGKEQARGKKNYSACSKISNYKSSGRWMFIYMLFARSCVHCCVYCFAFYFKNAEV